MRGFIGQIQSVGLLRYRIVDENKVRRIGSRQIANSRQHRILACAATRIACHTPRTALLYMISIGEGLAGFILDRGGIGRPLNRSGRFPECASESTCPNADLAGINKNGPGTVEDGTGTRLLRDLDLLALLRECAG
jgi:hypothetical protein